MCLETTLQTHVKGHRVCDALEQIGGDKAPLATVPFEIEEAAIPNGEILLKRMIWKSLTNSVVLTLSFRNLFEKRT